MTLLSSRLFNILNNVHKHKYTYFSVYNKFSSSAVSSEYDKRDPAPLFFNDEIQSILKTLTRVNLAKVFRKRAHGGHALETPSYKFMTSEELDEAMKEASIKAEKALQMPPVIQVYTETDSVLSKDPALTDFDNARYVITDITYGLSNSNRLIITRDPTGELKHANHVLRQRINQTYFPVSGRQISTPKMFEEKYLKSLLERQEYEYILDRSCIQFDPNDRVYHHVTATVYNHVNDNKCFDSLRSTRHFGPLTFYLCWIKSIDNLLLELIQTDFIIEAVQVISVLYKLHADCKSNASNRDILKEIKEQDNSQLIDSNTYEMCNKFVEDYIKKDSAKRGQLELALQSHKEFYTQRKIVSDGIKSAHGLSV